MKILVLGGTGMAGHTISIYFKKQGYDVTTLSRRPINLTKNITSDITDFPNLDSIVTKGDFDAVINAVGILNEEANINKDKAVLINSYLPHFLTEITKKTKTKIIHMSTDCVFSGEKGKYKENSIPDGKTFYDRSKSLGEIVNDKDLTFRTSIIGPDLLTDGIGLFNWFMKQDKLVYGYTKAIWTGVTTLTLAKAMEQALSDDLTGLYNLVNNDFISKYQLLNLFNENFRDGNLAIIPSEAVSLNKSLMNTRNDFSFIVPPYAQMISEMKLWIEDYAELYPHYKA